MTPGLRKLAQWPEGESRNLEIELLPIPALAKDVLGTRFTLSSAYSWLRIRIGSLESVTVHAFVVCGVPLRLRSALLQGN